MKPFFKTLIDILFLKASPADLPYSPAYLGILLITFFFMLAYELSFYLTFFKALIFCLLYFGSFATFTYFVLRSKSYTSRFVQTFSALMGVSVVMHVFIKIILIILPILITQENALLAMLLALMLMNNMWLFIVTAHIYRLALETHFMIGILNAVALLGINIFIYRLFIS